MEESHSDLAKLPSPIWDDLTSLERLRLSIKAQVGSVCLRELDRVLAEERSEAFKAGMNVGCNACGEEVPRVDFTKRWVDIFENEALSAYEAHRDSLVGK